MEDKVDPLSDFTIVLPNEAQYKEVLKAWHAAFAKDKPFEVSPQSPLDKSQEHLLIDCRNLQGLRRPLWQNPGLRMAPKGCGQSLDFGFQIK